MKDEDKVLVLRLNINITSNNTANNISTQDNDTSVSLSQLVDESKKEISPPVTCEGIKGYFCSDTAFNLRKKCLMNSKLKFWKRAWALYLHMI